MTDEADRLIAMGDQAEAEGNLPSASEYYRKAAVAAPAYAKAHLSLGVALEGLGDNEGAELSYEAALGADPANAYAAYNLGKMLYGRGVLARAAELLRTALEHKPEFPEAYVVRSGIYEAKGDLAAALRDLESALKQQPDWAGALLNYGLLLQRLGRLEEAETALSQAATLEAENPDVMLALASVLSGEGKHGEAIPVYRKVLAINPLLAKAHFGLANVLFKGGRSEEALVCYEKTAELDQAFAPAYVGQGNVLKQQGRTDAAIECYRKALLLDPSLFEAHFNLGAAFKDEDMFRDAQHHFEQALALAPESSDARWLHAMCQMPAVYESEDEPERARAAFSRALEGLDRWFNDDRILRGVSALGNQQPFYLPYQEENNRDLLQKYGTICVRTMQHWFDEQRFVVSGPPSHRGPIRVGFVSSHFYDHSVWNAIMKGWFEHLNRERFTVVGFHLGTDRDASTLEARNCAQHFEEGERDLRRWVQCILEQRLHVLIYPDIGMDTLTLRLGSLRLAPVQTASWGHPETTGLATMDYFLSADDIEPPRAQQNYTERLVPLPHLGCWFQRSDTNAPPPDWAAAGVELGCPVFICPGTPFKYAPRYDRIFVEIARRLGRCRFVFFTYSVRNMSDKLKRRLEAVFARKGMRLSDFAVFIPWQTRPAFYGWLQHADVFLDTIGFSGFNTAMQAVECAMPIVTREGRFMRGRLASGILKRMGIADLVVQSEEDYVALAVRLARDVEYRRHVHARIEQSRPILFEDLHPIRALEDFLTAAAARTR